MSIASSFERAIKEHKPGTSQQPFSDAAFVMPHYEGYSIANLGATIAKLLDRDPEGMAPSLPSEAWSHLSGDVRNIIVVLLDGTGYRYMERALEDERVGLAGLAERGQLVPLTSVFPTTTMTALSSLWTGTTPSQHGFLGTCMLLPEQGVLANLLKIAPAAGGPMGSLMGMGWNPATFVPVPFLAERLLPTGVKTVGHLLGMHLQGGLTKLFLRGVSELHGYIDHTDMWINLRHTIEEPSEEPRLINVYWTGTDDAAHTYGPGDERFAAALSEVLRSMREQFLERLSPSAREGTVLLITADHGQIDTPPQNVVSLSNHPKLNESLLLPPGGEPRAAYLYAKERSIGAIADYVGQYLAGRFDLVETDTALAAGVWGPKPLGTSWRKRLGDYLLLARGQDQLVYTEGKAAHLGHHGSLTKEEMLVPLFAVRLDD